MIDMDRSAQISVCKRYRFSLTRTWDTWQDRACIIMLNPSTADALKDDATIRALIRLLTLLDYGSFEVVNLFAWRATCPAALKTVEDPIGEVNDSYIFNSIKKCDIAVCAWGANPFVVQSKRGIAVRDLIYCVGKVPWCFGTTKSSAPKHPLYLKTGTTLEQYNE